MKTISLKASELKAGMQVYPTLANEFHDVVDVAYVGDDIWVLIRKVGEKKVYNFPVRSGRKFRTLKTV